MSNSEVRHSISIFSYPVIGYMSLLKLGRPSKSLGGRGHGPLWPPRRIVAGDPPGQRSVYILPGKTNQSVTCDMKFMQCMSVWFYYTIIVSRCNSISTCSFTSSGSEFFPAEINSFLFFRSKYNNNLKQYDVNDSAFFFYVFTRAI